MSVFVHWFCKSLTTCFNVMHILHSLTNAAKICLKTRVAHAANSLRWENMTYSASSFPVLIGGDEWVPLVDLLPDKKVSEPRMADFKRLAQLQDTLRVRPFVMRVCSRSNLQSDSV